MSGENGVSRNTGLGIAWLQMAAALGHIAARRALPVVAVPVASSGRPFCDSGQLLSAVLGQSANGQAAANAALVVSRVNQLAPAYGLDPMLVQAVIRMESGYRPDAISPKGAAGLMQLMPGTATRFGVRNVFAVDDNLQGGMAYLRWLLAYFRGNVPLTLAAYNAGEKTVDKYGGIPPYPETEAYVAAINRLYGATFHPFVTGLRVAASPVAPPPPERTPLRRRDHAGIP
jgi:soluble lytic murein transglycosylase-like protein